MRAKQSILKEISPEYSLKGLMLKLKLQYFGHLIWRTYSLANTLMLGKIEGREEDIRGCDSWMALPTQWTCIWASSGSWWKTGKPGTLRSMGLQRVGHDWGTELSIPLCLLLWLLVSLFSHVQLYGLQPARLLCPWDSLGRNARVGCPALLQGLFLTKGSNLRLLHCRLILYCWASSYSFLSIHLAMDI